MYLNTSTKKCNGWMCWRINIDEDLGFILDISILKQVLGLKHLNPVGIQGLNCNTMINQHLIIIYAIITYNGFS